MTPGASLSELATVRMRAVPHFEPPRAIPSERLIDRSNTQGMYLLSINR